MKALSLTVWLTLAAMTGYAMFHITFEVERLESELRDLNRLSEKGKDEVHHLKAEWSYLNRPDRLSELTRKFLPDWAPPTTDQIIAIDNLSENLADRGKPSKTKHRLKKPERRRYAKH
tara:strand:- start:115 stop:468 length:354 start_codon:yes stop_codon:yes gene_type:complete